MKPRPGPSASVPAGADLPWRLETAGVLVRVRVTPKSSRDAIEGTEATAEGPALKARVRAVPEDGKANAAVAARLAATLGLPKSAVAVVAGHKSRIKTLRVDGEPDAIAAHLAEQFAPLSSPGSGE